MAEYNFLAPGEGETAFTVSSSPIKFGAGAFGRDRSGRPGARHEAGRAVRRSARAGQPTGETAIGALRAAGLDVEVYDQGLRPEQRLRGGGRVRPRRGLRRLRLAGRRLRDGYRQGSQPAFLLPRRTRRLRQRSIGRAKPIAGRLKPHIACPTTAARAARRPASIVDLKSVGLKTGIASPLLKPSLAIVDPTTTETLPGGVVAASGFDVLTHAVESYTARP